MKTNLLLLLLLLPFKNTIAQINLVPNPSFEDTVACPTNYSGQYGEQIYNLNYWFPSGNSPDYFNSCANTAISIPVNGFGSQIAKEGNGYVGLFTSVNNVINYREYIGVSLLQNLTIGTKYFFKMFISPGFGGVQYVNTFSNNFGIKLSSIQFESFFNPLVPDNSSTSNFDSIISDTTIWHAINFSFIADSSYQYLYIGNFFDNMQTDTISVTNVAFNQGAYYYVDNICLSTDSNFCETILNTYEKEAITFTISPNPIEDMIHIQSSINIVELKLYNLQGKLLGTIKMKSNSIDYNISEFPSGNYLIKIIGNNNQHKSTIIQKL